MVGAYPKSGVPYGLQPWNSNRRKRLSTVDLLIKAACFVKKKIMVTISKSN
jgi:hypothetical protein